MAITQAFCTSAKAEFLGGIIDLDSDVIKIALYISEATLDAATTVYSSTNEVSGSGYSAGGNVLTGATIGTSGTTAFVSFTNTFWSSATFTARGALIYDSSKGNRAIAVLNFGADKTVVNQTFTIEFPAADASSAIVRIA
jgi:hypothetical protein